MKALKRIFPWILAAALLFVGCGQPNPTGPQKYQATYFTVFDTVTFMQGYAESEEALHRITDPLEQELLYYHQLFDIYHSYEGINNLKTINDNAGIAPVKVDQPILDLLNDCKKLYEATDGAVDVAMGSVLRIWHNAREVGIDNPEEAYLPKPEELQTAAEHTSFDTVILDGQASTVYLADPEQRLDVGAIAKGWSVERVCEKAPKGLLISVGGNVRCTGPKPEGENWVVGVRDPDGMANEFMYKLNVTGGCIVTSGDYERYFVYEGKRYHHIIDPKTLFPSERWRSVTIVCNDSGIADALSTALFILPKEQGERLLSLYGAEAVWVDANGTATYTDGIEAMMKRD